MRRLAFAAVLAGGLQAGAAQAEPLPCGADGGEAVTVQEVAPDLSLRLADGRQLRLAGIEPVRDTPDRPDAADAARATLAKWLAGREVRISVLGPPDRWERAPAFVSAPAAPDGPALAVAVQIVDAGLARARPESVPATCWAALLRAEASAREGVLGVWADPYYAVRAASDGPALLPLAGEWVVVEGRVAHVGQTRTATYLDLDARRGGLALRVERSVPLVSGTGKLDPGQWLGRRIRARGVLADRNGPQVEIRDPAQIEPLPSTGVPGDAAHAGD